MSAPSGGDFKSLSPPPRYFANTATVKWVVLKRDKNSFWFILDSSGPRKYLNPFTINSFYSRLPFDIDISR